LGFDGKDECLVLKKVYTPKRKLMIKRKTEGLKGISGGQSQYEESFRRMVVREYETGNLSLSQLAVKYGLKIHNLKYWKRRFSSDIAVITTIEDTAMTPEEEKEQTALKKQLAALKKEVEYLKMKELAMEALVDIAKEKYDIDLRKKTGTKPSGE
jgi:transposase-like protein